MVLNEEIFCWSFQVTQEFLPRLSENQFLVTFGKHPQNWNRFMHVKVVFLSVPKIHIHYDIFSLFEFQSSDTPMERHVLYLQHKNISAWTYPVLQIVIKSNWQI